MWRVSWRSLPVKLRNGRKATRNVRQAQIFLIKIGIRLKADGVNDYITRRAVRMFQRTFSMGPYVDSPLVGDGDPGPLTLAAMRLCETSNFKASENFAYREFKTHGMQTPTLQNHVIRLDRDLVTACQKLRRMVGPVVILSAYRDSVHNARIGGATRSQHLLGKAIDMDRRKMARVDEATARAAGFNGIGMLSRANPVVIHMDVRKTATRWYYT